MTKECGPYFLALFVFLLVDVKALAAQSLERVSVNDSGQEGNGESVGAPSDWNLAINADGRYVAFSSLATNLVGADTNGTEDVFVYDRDTDSIERVSVNDSGQEGDNFSDFVAINNDGRYVAFCSWAANLVAGDTNGSRDVFVYDRDTDTIERVSVDNSGQEGNAHSWYPSISDDGQLVAFFSAASNLVSGDTNASLDVFVYDRGANTIERVSVNDSAQEGDGDSSLARISADGRYVAFCSLATNLVAGDTNGAMDVFVYDRNTSTIERVSINDSAQEGNAASMYPSLSSDGRYVAFSSWATNLVAGPPHGLGDVYVYDRDTDTIEMVSVNDSGLEGNGGSSGPSISADGRYVAFYSSATDLVTGDTNGVRDIFIYDRNADTIERVSVNDSAQEGNDESTYTVISANGQYTALASAASNLVSGDTNGCMDVFAAPEYTSPPTPTPTTTGAPLVASAPVVITNNQINPTFGEKTTIHYDVSRAGRVQIEIFDTLGSLVYTVVDEQTGAGKYQVTWDGRDDKGIIVASGIYFLTVRTNEYTVKENIVVIK